jgi:hypothetical protein
MAIALQTGNMVLVSALYERAFTLAKNSQSLVWIYSMFICNCKTFLTALHVSEQLTAPSLSYLYQVQVT